MRALKILGAVALGAAVLLPGNALAAGPAGWTLAWTPGPVLESQDGKVTLKARGRLIVDHARISDSDGNPSINATGVRAARFGIDGKAGKHFFFRLESDFSVGVFTPTDLYVGWKGKVEIRGGHFRIGPSLEGATSGRFVPLFERASFIDAFGLGRQFGAALAKTSEHGTVAFGVFKGGFGGKGDDTGVLMVGRINHAFPIAGGFIHVGGAVRYREPGAMQDAFIYRTRAIQHQAPRFVGTGAIGDNDLYLGAELGLFRGPLAVNGDFAVMSVDLAAPLPGQSDPTFVGGYVNVSYFLTGEDAPYDPDAGALNRPKVKRPVFKGGAGAWQAVVRYDFVDLTDNGVFGGVQKAFIGGINWWLTSHFKIAFAYSRSNVRQAFLIAANGPDGANAINAVGFRTQIDW